MFSTEDFATDCAFMSPADRCKALCRLLRSHGYSTLSSSDHELIEVVSSDGVECLASNADEVLGWLGY